MPPPMRRRRRDAQGGRGRPQRRPAARSTVTSSSRPCQVRACTYRPPCPASFFSAGQSSQTAPSVGGPDASSTVHKDVGSSPRPRGRRRGGPRRRGCSRRAVWVISTTRRTAAFPDPDRELRPCVPRVGGQAEQQAKAEESQKARRAGRAARGRRGRAPDRRRRPAGRRSRDRARPRRGRRPGGRAVGDGDGEVGHGRARGDPAAVVSRLRARAPPRRRLRPRADARGHRRRGGPGNGPEGGDQLRPARRLPATPMRATAPASTEPAIRYTTAARPQFVARIDAFGPHWTNIRVKLLDQEAPGARGKWPRRSCLPASASRTLKHDRGDR